MLKNLIRKFSKKGDFFIKEQKYRLARKHYLEELPKLKYSLSLWKSYLSTKKKIAFCELKLKNKKKTLSILKEIIKDLKSLDLRAEKEKGEKKKFLETSYENLMLFYLKENPNEALELGTNLIEKNKKSENDNRKFISKITSHLGLAELLNDDILEAKDLLISSLQKGKEYELLRIAMNQNNLGLACWWDRYPNYSNMLVSSSEDDSEEEFSEKAYRTKNSDFSFSYFLFKKSIKNFERSFFYYPMTHPETMEFFKPKNVNKLQKFINIIDKDEILPDSYKELMKFNNEDKLVTNPLSSVPLMNISEFLLSTTKTTHYKEKGLFYLHLAFTNLHKTLKLLDNNEFKDSVFHKKFFYDYEELYNSLYIRCLTIMACTEIENKAMNLDLFWKAHSFIKKDNICNNSIFCMNRLGKFLVKTGKIKEGESLIHRGYQYEAFLKPYELKLNHIILPNLSTRLLY